MLSSIVGANECFVFNVLVFKERILFCREIWGVFSISFPIIFLPGTRRSHNVAFFIHLLRLSYCIDGMTVGIIYIQVLS